MTTLTINFFGIPLIVRGTYNPPEPSIGASFSIQSVKAKIVRAYEITENAELSPKDIDQAAWESIEEACISAAEDSLEAAAEEAADARREARRDAQLE